MRRLRSLAFPLAILTLSVVPVRADEPAPALPPPPGAGPRVRLVTRVIDVLPAVAARWRDEATPAWRALDGAEVARLLERQAENVITSADTDVALEQRSTLEVLHRSSYVADYDVETSMGTTVANPIVQTVVAGTVLDVVPTESGDRLLLALEIRHTWVPPIRTERVEVAGAGREVTVQHPEVVGRTWQGTLRVPRGGHLLLLGAEGLPSQGGRSRLLLVTATRVEEALPPR
jgi:hypothetical protein